MFQPRVFPDSDLPGEGGPGFPSPTCAASDCSSSSAPTPVRAPRSVTQERRGAPSSHQVERYIDLLADEDVHLDEPFTRQLRGKLRELRFHLGRQQARITYYIATGRRIVLLTVFVKTRQRERREVQRAWSAMQTCIAEGHTVEDDE